jgi:hypothetical protein
MSVRSSAGLRRGLATLGDQGLRGIRAGPDEFFGCPEVDAERDQAGLRAVVQVTFKPPQFGRGGVDGFGAGLGQLLNPGGQGLARLQVGHDRAPGQREAGGQAHEGHRPGEGAPWAPGQPSAPVGETETP